MGRVFCNLAYNISILKAFMNIYTSLPNGYEPTLNSNFIFYFEREVALYTSTKNGMVQGTELSVFVLPHRPGGGGVLDPSLGIGVPPRV